MNKLKYQILHPLLMWLIIVIGGIILWQVVPEGFLFELNKFGIIIFALGLINWLYVYTATLKVHKKAFTHIHNINELVTEGKYAVVRHPMYLADIILGCCVFILNPSYRILAILIWLALILLFWANLEERLLEEKFLEDYRAYKRNVPMFIPRFRKRKEY